MKSSTSTLVLLSGLLACGPAVATDDDDATSGSTEGPIPGSTSTSPPPGSTSRTPDPPPPTTTTTSGPPPQTTGSLDTSTGAPGDDGTSVTGSFLPTDTLPEEPCDLYLQDCPPG